MDTKPKILYHGSQYKITDGVIRTKPAYVTKTKTPINAVFATSDFLHARLYAFMGLGSGYRAPQGTDILYVEKMNHEIPEKAYVYELDTDGFEYDANTDYYSVTDKKIKNIIEIDIMQEIKNGNIKIYFLKNKIDFSKMSKEQARALWRELKQKQTNFELYNPSKYYHGSHVEINDGYLQQQRKF